MSRDTRRTYLETQILTATPQKCRLMLIEGAIRFARQALESWGDENRTGQPYAALARCNDILAELSSSVRAETDQVAAQVKSVYQFLLIQLARFCTENDPKILREVIEVLEVERETWQQVCEKFPETLVPQQGEQGAAEDVTASGMSAIASPATTSGNGGNAERFSLEA